MHTEKFTARDVALIGGSTCDITGVLLGEPHGSDSNPSRIHTSHGGVGRNIAENLARLGLKVRFVSAFGTDAFSDELIAFCEALGMDTRLSYIKEGARACTYIDLLDAKGELLLAASDMSTMEEFPLDLLANAVKRLNAHKLTVLDANLTEDALRCVAEHSESLLLGETVSITKAKRFRAILPRLYAVKANAGELAALTGRRVESERDIACACADLLAAGVKRVFVTMGRNGAFCADGGGTTRTPGFPAEVCSVTGAGDAFCAAIAYGILRDLPTEDMLLLGAAMSRITLKSPFAVSREMSESEALRVKDALAADPPTLL
ncbi:MAG: carbohydrate kinase family protein [Clostridiales Family XIII bacterium]|jgi:pseudouridine kinase|nr:carbohydrate kinase family protein [Clostridiales Family XIII bacterium]